jgi:hypothetical protein
MNLFFNAARHESLLQARSFARGKNTRTATSTRFERPLRPIEVIMICDLGTRSAHFNILFIIQLVRYKDLFQQVNPFISSLSGHD